MTLLSPGLQASDRATQLPEPDVRYAVIDAGSLAEFSEQLAPEVLAQVESLVRARHCPAGAVKLYRGAAAEAARILTHTCFPPRLAQDDPRFHAYLEYPLTLVLEQDRVRELDLSPHAFMYESGVLSAVSDVDGNGQPELWLSGQICECDGEPSDYGPEGCQCEGIAVLELREGVLSPRPPASASSASVQ